MKIGSKYWNNHHPAGFSCNYWCFVVFFKNFSWLRLLFFSVQQRETREIVAETVAWLNMGFSAGLTLQMDLIVLRNSIFCHSACMPCPSPGPSCSQRSPYQQQSGCETEQLSSAPDPKLWKRATGKWTGVRRTGTGREENNFLGDSYCCRLRLFALVHSQLHVLDAPVYANRGTLEECEPTV